VPGDGEGRAPRCERPGPAPTTTATNGPVIVPDTGDPRRIGELLGAWLDVRMGEVDDLVAEARLRVNAIPDVRTLWLILGEVLVRTAAVEYELAELRKASRR
jgi:hypothetical protein